jgi:hypothetical protein
MHVELTKLKTTAGGRQRGQKENQGQGVLEEGYREKGG